MRKVRLKLKKQYDSVGEGISWYCQATGRRPANLKGSEKGENRQKMRPEELLRDLRLSRLSRNSDHTPQITWTGLSYTCCLGTIVKITPFTPKSDLD